MNTVMQEKKKKKTIIKILEFLKFLYPHPFLSFLYLVKLKILDHFNFFFFLIHLTFKSVWSQWFHKPMESVLDLEH